MEYNYEADMKLLGCELTVYGTTQHVFSQKEETETMQLSNVIDINTRTRVKLKTSTPE